MSDYTARYLKDLVAERLAERGNPGTVEIRPRVPLAVRLDTGERTTFVVDFRGAGRAQLQLEEWEISTGTVGASVVDSLADKIEKAMQHEVAA